MKQIRSLLTGAVAVLLAAACSESPTSPGEVAPRSKVMEVPEAGPVFTAVPGSLQAGSTPPGGVTIGSTGSAVEPGGQMFNYADVKSGNFAFLAWTPTGSMPVAAVLNGFPVQMSYDGPLPGGEEDVVSGAVWSGQYPVTINGEIDVIPLRVVFNAGGFQPAANFDTLSMPAVGAVAVIPGTTFNVRVSGEAFFQGMWQPMNQAFTSIAINGGPAINGSVAVSPAFLWTIASCEAGNYMDVNAGGCQPSPAGSYSPGGYATFATQCETGTYQPDTGQASCIAADAGYYVSQPGLTSQTACGNGRYQPDAGQFGCLSAPPGHYASGTAQTEVTACSPGYYSSGYGNSSCTPAPRGTYAAESAAPYPVACAPGSYNNTLGQTACSLAPAGTYATGPGAHTPTVCPVGTYTATSGNSSCTLSPAGSYVPETRSTYTRLCLAGTFSGTGQASCTPAPAGSFVDSDGAGSATLCAAGYYQPSTGQTSCIAADAGSYAAGPGAVSSSLCSAGSFSSSAAAGSCTLASPGSYVPGAGATSSVQCAAGYYQPTSGASSCVAAAIGFYVSSSGATSQTACAVGYTTNSTASTSCVRMAPIAAYDALVSAAQTTPGVAASEVTKLSSARKQLVSGKTANACKAIDSFVGYVNKQTGKTITAANAATLIRKTQDADVAIGC